MRSGFIKFTFFVLLVVLFAGCTLKYAINEPVVSDFKYDTGETKHLVMKIVDQRSDTKFHHLTSGLKNVNIALENIEEDPIKWLSQALEKEFAARGISLEITGQESQAPPDFVLIVKKFEITSRRVSGFSPWETYHSFMGELQAGGQSCTIPAYFFNGKVPIWSMSEVLEPCFNMPLSIIVKEIASKVNRCALHYSVSDEMLKTMNNRLHEKLKVKAEDAYFAVLEMGGSNNPGAMKTLVAVSDDQDRFIRACALSSIGTFGARDEFEFLKKKYDEYQEVDRFMALKSIGDLGTPEAIDFIRKAKSDPQYSGENGFKYCVDLFLDK